MNIWGQFSPFVLLWLMSQTFMFNFFSYEHMFSIFLDRYPGVEWLGHMATLCMTFEELSDSFSISNVSFYILTAMYEVSNFFTCSPVLFFFPLI